MTTNATNTNTKTTNTQTTTSMTQTTTTTSLADETFGIVNGSISNQTNLRCPSTLGVGSSNNQLFQGYYEITNQTRRGQPVWYNKEKDTFLSVAKSLRWYIQPSKNYNADDDVTHGYSETYLPVQSGKVWCPQNLVYLVWTNGKWTKDLIKVLGKIKFDLHLKIWDKFFHKI